MPWYEWGICFDKRRHGAITREEKSRYYDWIIVLQVRDSDTRPKALTSRTISETAKQANRLSGTIRTAALRLHDFRSSENRTQKTSRGPSSPSSGGKSSADENYKTNTMKAEGLATRVSRWG